MREIKFRAWNKETKVMLPVEQWASRSWVAVPVQVGEEEWELNQLKLEDIELMQFAGLLDRNGKEIYEGDITLHVDHVVVENIGSYGRTEPEGILTEVKIPDFYNFTHYEIEVDELEVIGNIYENPELIEKI